MLRGTGTSGYFTRVPPSESGQRDVRSTPTQKSQGQSAA